MTETTYFRWRAEFEGMKSDQVKRLKELKLENAGGGWGRNRRWTSWGRSPGANPSLAAALQRHPTAERLPDGGARDRHSQRRRAQAMGERASY